MQGSANLLSSLLPLVVLFAIFYFLVIRPQQKQVKKHKEMLDALQKGDKVITTGGIYGKVAEVKDNFVMMDVGGDIRLKVDKNALLKDTSVPEQN